MFTAIQHMPFTLVLCGVIWSVALGFAVGNYACSLVHRLPRGKPMLDKTPYCGSCGTLLKTKDLFPVVSALLLKHRCRYCQAKFPTSHTWTEILVGLLFVLAFFKFNFGEEYFLIVTIGTFLITLAAIEANDRIVMGKILLCVAVSGMLYRTLLDHTIFDFFFGGFYALLAGAALTHKHIRRTGHIYTLPPPALLLAVGGICVGQNGLPLFLLLFILFWAVSRIFGKIPLTVPFGFAVILPLLYGYGLR